MESIHKHYVYILECGDGSYYTGYTNDIDKRIRKHELGQAAKYTRGRGPVKLVFQHTCKTKTEALRMEYAIKKLSRSEKVRLVKEERSVPYVDTKKFSKS